MDQSSCRLRARFQKSSPASYQCHQQPARIHVQDPHGESMGRKSRRREEVGKKESRVERRGRSGNH